MRFVRRYYQHTCQRILQCKDTMSSKDGSQLSLSHKACLLNRHRIPGYVELKAKPAQFSTRKYTTESPVGTAAACHMGPAPPDTFNNNATFHQQPQGS